MIAGATKNVTVIGGAPNMPAQHPKPTIPMVPNPVMIPITLGSAMFSLTEPFPGKALEYNRWYERDHFFAHGQQLPYFFTGRPFVAPPAPQALRHPDPCNPVANHA